MSTIRFVVFGALIMFGFLSETVSSKQGYFTIVAPGTVRSNSVFHVSVSLNDFHQSCWFNISLTNFFVRSQRYVSKTIEMHPNTTKLFELQVPSLDDKRGYLEIIGYRGIISREDALINFETGSYSAFIQTNKAKFKPGELVQFRVIIIDKLTRPAKVERQLSVKIYDGQKNLIRKIFDVKLVMGVFKSELQLSDHPVLGEWNIQVEVDGDVFADKSFEVARYVLPTFSVTINTKPIVSVDEDKIVLEINANYFYGEPVTGNLTILLNNTYFAPGNEKLPIFRKELHIYEKNTIIVIDMKSDLHIETKNQSAIFPKTLYKFSAEAIVIDDLSEQQLKAGMEIEVYSQRFKIKLRVPKVFDGSDEILFFKVQTSVTDLQNNPISDIKNMVKIQAQCVKYPVDDIKINYTHEIGKIFDVIKIFNKNYSNCDLFAEYQGSRSLREHIKTNQESISLDILTESPEVGKELKIKIKSKDPIKSFSYEILARGDIIKSEYIEIQKNQTLYEHIFCLNMTYAMVPKITIYAHSVENRNFAGQVKDVYIKRAFQNSIEIKTDAETKPGSLVYINVTTDEGSYVGLMGLDQSLMQNIQNNADDLNEDYFYTKLRNYDSLSIDFSHFPGIKAGLITLSNAITKIGIIGSRFGDSDRRIVSGSVDQKEENQLPEQFDKPTLEFPRIRKLFSESWLYKDIERSSTGSFSLLETVPDRITSWAITGFSLNANTGITLTKNITNLKVFQEFFVSIDLPSLVKEGETIEVSIYISNYMKQDVLTNVTIERESEDLDILKDLKTEPTPKATISKLVPANKREKVVIWIKPRKSGQYNVTVKAISQMASDAVQKTLIVESEGIPYAISKTYLVHLPEESIKEDEITIDIPNHAVSGSQRVEISVTGDIFRPLTRSLQTLAIVPYGNGEDNMRYIISNLLVLKYFKALNYTNPNLQSKIKLNIELGYQNQLSFKHLDGSFGLLHRSNEKTGDIWNTAFTLWGLKQAANFIQIDNQVIQRGLNYLKSKQSRNGCFKSTTGMEGDVKLTALGLMVFIMNDNSRTLYEDVITKGLAFLYDLLENWGHSSVSVMSTYVLLLGKHENATSSLGKFVTANAARLTSKQVLWTKSDTLQSNLATTAETLMNLFASQNQPKQVLVHIVRSLIGLEGEDSSLTHMIALQAMIIFVEELHLTGKNLNITFKNDHKESGGFQVDSVNSQVLRTLEISPNSRKVYLQSKGYGFAVVDVKFKYNIIPENQTYFTYKTNITTKRTSDNLSVLDVCLSLLTINNQNNLTILEINLQSGYIFTDEIENLRQEVKSVQVNGSRDKVVVYLKNIENNGICLQFQPIKIYKVVNVKPGWVIVYGLHEEDQKIANSFKI